MEDSVSDKQSSNKTKEDTVKEITELRKNIKHKHRLLKRDILESDEMWENRLKPITEPLKLLVEESKQIQQKQQLQDISQYQMKRERKRRVEDYSETTTTKIFIPNPVQGVKRKKIVNHPLQPEYESDYEYGEDDEQQPVPKRLASHHSNMETTEIEGVESGSEMITEPILPQTSLTRTPLTPSREEVFETPISGEDLIKTPQGKKLAKEFIETNFKGKIARKYFLKLINGGKTIDYNYGVRIEENSWMMGSKLIDIDDDDIIIDGVRYRGTPGLYELIFMNIPNDFIYSQEDLHVYAQILAVTNAHRINYSSQGRVKSNRGIKYKTIISKLHANNIEERQDMMTYPDILTQAASGSGIPLTNDKPKYIYFDDPNELVDRLQILLASEKSGNTAHTEEINSIMEELYELKPVLSKQLDDLKS